MKLMKRIFTALLILLTFNLYLPNPAFADQTLTKHPLETRSTPEEDMTTIKKKKTSGWTWLIVLGLVGGMVAVAAGGDGGDNGGDSETGDVDYDW